MASEVNSSARSTAGGASGGGGSSSADSYIGSLISLTSKSEIRYEGILYNINTEESSIGLRHVRSFGTEGRKKDGPQVPPSDKVYDYILFRGSDIKDLQVKFSPPAQSTLPLNNDPAIIQSHYPRPASTSTSLPPAGTGSLGDLNSQSGLLGLPGSNFQGGLPLYQPGGTIGSWGASPSPGPSGSGLAMPMYWQGYYGTPNGLPQMQQQSLLRPPPGMSMPPSMQPPLQYPNLNAPLPNNASDLPTSNLPEGPSHLLPPSTGSANLIATSLSPSMLSSNLSTISSAPLTSETLPSSTSSVVPNPSLPNATSNASLPSMSALTTNSPELSPAIPPISNKTIPVVGQTPPYQIQSSTQSTSSVGASKSVRPEAPTPSLVTPSQLTQSVSNSVSASQPLQVDHKDVEVVQVSSSPSAELPVPVATEAQPPILPLPKPGRAAQKSNGPPFHNCYSYRGRERGRGAGSSRPVTKFTEEFDFEAMNEKFKKDEVWGHLGKNSKSHLNEKGENAKASDEDNYEEDDAESQKIEVKPVYQKDDFFDTLSCNALDNGSYSGRTRFSEQLKIDAETFGEFARHRGGRGGRGPSQSGNSRGGYYGGYGNYGRGYGYGYGYGYGGRGRGRGRSMPNRP